ncbi:MAG: fasciclin domain-containing protein [Methanoregula sp.]|nr:fasciclin domain-containing protein [Methanoregula sp.]
MKKKSIFLVLAVIITTMVLLAGCATTQPPQGTSNSAPMTTATISTGGPVTQAAMKTIIETAESDGRFTSFVAAAKAADLNDTLSDPDSTITVFAPTDDTFRNLPDGTMDALLKDPQGDLLQILLYHMVSEKLMAVDLEKLTSAETLQGGSLPISVSNSTLRVDGAIVIITDIECSNGVIHGVDTLMLPPA